MYQCFEKVTNDERETLIKNFNLIGNWNDQSSYLTSLMSVCQIAKRRPRKEDADVEDCSFRYIVRDERNNVMVEIPVCAKAFIALRGIGVD